MNTPKLPTTENANPACNVIDLAAYRAARDRKADVSPEEAAWAADHARFQPTRDALCREVAPELLVLSRSECLTLLTPAQRDVVSAHPWFDVRNIACWNLIRESERDPDGGGGLRAA
jgi:hypothetical protein